ncbi:hypothetical protein KC878_01540, partial [Candidatus Saccharibacteria bacterium]|nr:hypothetical protein [Candidatus Saccharibacteria bacterium]
MYTYILIAHIIAASASVGSIFFSMFSKRKSYYVYSSSLVATAASGVAMIFLGADTVMVCVRLASLVGVAVIFRLLV